VVLRRALGLAPQSAKSLGVLFLLDALERFGGEPGDLVLLLLGRGRRLARQFDGGLYALVRRRHRCTTFDLTQHVGCELAD